MFRGGSYFGQSGYPHHCRSANRDDDDPSYRSSTYGGRLVLKF